jgi:hypothetical protein
VDEPMKPTERLLNAFIPLMQGEGYEYRKTNHRFLKPFVLGKHEFSLRFDGRGGLVAVGACFFVHFEALLKQLKKILGQACPWSAGGTLLMAGADPWKFWLFDEKFAEMTIQERSGFPSDEIHPESRIQSGARFLLDAHNKYALPFFEKLQTYEELAEFYREYLDSDCTGQCRPHAEYVLYLSLILAACLGNETEPIERHGDKLKSALVRQDIDSNVQKVLAYIRSTDVTQMLR